MAINRSIAVVWLAWLVYWAIAARGVKAERWREPRLAQTLRAVPLFGAVWLLFGQTVPATLRRPVFRFSPLLEILGLVLVLAGLGFSVWARRHLGRNWSGNVTVKHEHALVTSGPYRYARHPIYTGLLTALLGTAVALNEWRGPLAVVLATVAFVVKFTVEERRMRETFPEYDEYARRTAALVPFIY